MNDETIHSLKIHPKYFTDVKIGRKTFEVRFNDRDFRVGDVIAFYEYANGVYTGRTCVRYISYILNDPKFCKEGYVILGLKEAYEWHLLSLLS